jgi:hypothetical protein
MPCYLPAMPRPRKSGARTRSGRLSRSYKGPARDAVTPELQRKKLALVNGAADPALSSSAASILFAHGVFDRDQLAAADRYHKLYRRSFGMPDYGRCLLGDRSSGPAIDDDVLVHARRQLDAMVSRLTPEQKLQIDNLLVSNWLPGWFYAAQGIGRAIETDAAERDALLTGLEALARV